MDIKTISREIYDAVSNNDSAEHDDLPKIEAILKSHFLSDQYIGSNPNGTRKEKIVDLFMQLIETEIELFNAMNHEDNHLTLQDVVDHLSRNKEKNC